MAGRVAALKFVADYLGLPAMSWYARRTGSGWLDEIPLVAKWVLKNGDCPIGFGAGLFEEIDALAKHCHMIAGKVIRLKKQEHPATRLVANCGPLLRPVCTRQQQTAFGTAGWRDKNPALFVRQPGVFNQFESERTNVEGQGLIVVWHDDRNCRKKLPRCHRLLCALVDRNIREGRDVDEVDGLRDGQRYAIIRKLPFRLHDRQRPAAGF